MSKLLVSLLGVNEQRFSEYVDRLEHAALRPGVDVRLSADVITKSRSITKQLGLDPERTTAEQTYNILLQKVASDDARLIAKLGLQQGNFEQNAEIIASKAASLVGRDMTLCITASGIKRLLMAVPPKRTLKVLRYRSLESVLKRNDPRAVYALAHAIENDSWRAQVYAKMRRLDSKDIQWQTISVIALPEGWYGKITAYVEKSGAFLVNEEAGTICVLPVIDSNRSGSTTLGLGLILQTAGQMSSKSLPYRALALHEGYNSLVGKIAEGNQHIIGAVHGIEPSWRVVHELIGAGHVSSIENTIEFESFDLFWEDTEMRLAAIDHAFDFWIGTHYVGLRAQDQPVSMHVLDIAFCVTAGLTYAERRSTHMVSSLWNELQLRYLREEVIARSLASQLTDFSGTVVL